MHKVVHNPAVHHGYMTDEESQHFEAVLTVCADLLKMDLVHANLSGVKEIFTNLEKKLGNLSSVMTRTRRDPKPFLVQYMGGLCKQWYFECVLCITRTLQKKLDTEQSSKPLVERLVAARHGQGDLESVLNLADFLDIQALQATLAEKSMTTVLKKFPDHEIEVLKTMASLASQLSASAGQKMLKKWKEYHALPSSIGIEAFETLARVSKDLMRTDVAHLLLRDATLGGGSVEHMLEIASGYLAHLCQTVSKGIKESSTGLIKKIGTCSKKAQSMLLERKNHNEVYLNEVSELLSTIKREKEDAKKQWGNACNQYKQKKQVLGQQLDQKAKETAKLYAEFWGEVNASYQRKMQPKWYANQNFGSVFLDLSKRLQEILKKQKFVCQYTADQKPIELEDVGLERVPLIVELQSWDVDVRFFQSRGDTLELRCEGGLGGPFCYHNLPRHHSLDSQKFVVLDPSIFTLVITAYQDGSQSILERFPLHRLHDSCAITKRTRRSRGCQIAFSAVTHEMYVRNSSPLQIKRTRNPVRTSEAFAEELNNHFKNYNNLFTQFRNCLESEAESLRYSEEASQTVKFSGNDRVLMDNSWHMRAMMWGKQFAENLSQVLDDTSKCLEVTKAQTQCLDAIRKGSEKLSVILHSPPNVYSDFSMRLVEELSLARVSSKELPLVWTAKMRHTLEQLELDVNVLQTNGNEARLNLFELYVTVICQHAISVTKEEDLKIVENRYQEWKTFLERNLSLFDQEMLLNRESLLEVALSMGKARIECITLAKQLDKRMELSQKLGTTAIDILRGTQLRHSSKITICGEDGTLSLSSLDCAVDFGVVLHENDVLASDPGSHVYAVEVENRTSESICVDLSVLDPSSQLFREIGSTTAMLYGKTSWYFKFHMDSNAVGKITEMWKIASGDKRLNAKFKMTIEVQRLAVQLSTDAIDFGTVTPKSQNIKKTLSIENVTDFPLLVKSQVQISQTRTRFTISPQSFHLDARSSRSLTVTINSGNMDEKIDTEMILGIVGNMKHIPIKAQVTQPQYELVTDTGRVIQETIFRLPVVPPGKKTQAAIRIRNIGTVPVVYRLTCLAPNSSALKVVGGTGAVRAYETSSDILISMRNREYYLLLQQELRVQVDGCIERELRVEGKWVESKPQFLKRNVDFQMQPLHLDAIAKGCRSVALEAANTVENKADIGIKIYPPSSEHFAFDRPYYVLDPRSKAEIKMSWQVRTLRVKESTVVFCTENQKKLKFAVQLKLPEVNELQFFPRNLFFNPLDVGDVEMRELKIVTKKLLFINTNPAKVAQIQSLALKSKTAVKKRSSHKKGPWKFGSADIPTEFQPKHNCVVTQIELKTSEVSGWIVETLQIQSEDDYLVEDDLSFCLPLRYNVVLLTYAGLASSAAQQMMQLCSDPNRTSRSSGRNLKNCLPNLHLLRTFQQHASTIQVLFLLMLCEMQVLKSEWTLSEEKATHVLHSNPEEIPRMCAQYAGESSQELDELPGTSQNIEEYFESVREIFDSGNESRLGDFCLPCAILDGLTPDLQRMMVALYMLRADCQDEQQLRASVMPCQTCQQQLCSTSLAERCGKAAKK